MFWFFFSLCHFISHLRAVDMTRRLHIDTEARGDKLNYVLPAEREVWWEQMGRSALICSIDYGRLFSLSTANVQRKLIQFTSFKSCGAICPDKPIRQKSKCLNNIKTHSFVFICILNYRTVCLCLFSPCTDFYPYLKLFCSHLSWRSCGHAVVFIIPNNGKVIAAEGPSFTEGLYCNETSYWRENKEMKTCCKSPLCVCSCARPTHSTEKSYKGQWWWKKKSPFTARKMNPLKIEKWWTPDQEKLILDTYFLWGFFFMYNQLL